MRCRHLAIVLLLLPALAHAGEEPAPEKPRVDPKVVQWVEEIQRASQGEDGSDLLPFFDFTTLVQTLEKEGYLAGIPPKVRPLAHRALDQGMRRAVRMHTVITPFATFSIRSLAPIPAIGGFTLYVRVRDADGVLSKLRLHVIRRDDGFAIFDVEDLDLGLGYVQIIGLLIVDAMGGLGEGLRGVGPKLLRAQSLLEDGAVDEAHDMLLELEALDLPIVLSVFVHLALSGTTSVRGELEASLQHLDTVAELRPDIPLEQYQRAAVQNLRGEYDAALAAARRYVQLLDADADVRLELGIAFHGLGRTSEALDALAPALAEAPDATDVLAYFALCLPPERHAELGKHFAALPDPILGHRAVADVFLEHGNAPLLRLFAGYLARVAPKHYDVAHYRGHALLLEEKYAEAAAQLEIGQDAMFAAPEAEQPESAATRETYMDALLDALLALDDPIGAYRRVHDPAYAFGYIAYEVAYTKEDPPLLRRYLEHVRSSMPDTDRDRIALQVRFYDVEADLLDEKRDEAVTKLLALVPAAEKASEAHPDDDALENLLWDAEDRLVRALLHTKRLDEAWELASRIHARDDDPLYLALVHVTKGEVAKAIARIEASVAYGREAEDLFDDRDMEAALAGPAYAALRKKLLGDG